MRVLSESFPERAVGATGDLPTTVRRLAGRLGLDPTDGVVARACTARREAQWRLFAPRPDALDTLRALRARGLRLGLLSECTLELAEAWPRLPYAELIEQAV